MPKAPGKFQQTVLRDAPGVQAQDIVPPVLRAGEEDTALGADRLQGVRIVPRFRSLFRGGENARSCLMPMNKFLSPTGQVWDRIRLITLRPGMQGREKTRSARFRVS